MQIMPITLAAFGSDITTLIGKERAAVRHLDLATLLIQAVVDVVILNDADMLNVETAFSGGGSAYGFLMKKVSTNAGKKWTSG